jgi:6-phospho-beta-glucosidase
MQGIKAYEKLTVDAGLKGDRDVALAALLTNPLVGDYSRAKGVFEEMLEAHKEYLPRFFS